MSKGGSSIPSDYTIKLGSDGSTIHIDTDLDNIHVKEIAPLTVNSNIAVTQPIVSQSKSDSAANVDLKLEPIDLKIEPLKVDSDSKSEIDVKPLVVDSCQTLKLAPLPPIRMEQPYSQHFGLTYMGIELWGMNISGHSETILGSPPKSNAPRTLVSHPPCDEPSAHQPSRQRPSSGGLRVRVK